MYKIVYFVPKQAKEKTKEALFAIGVGMFEKYECCSFETLGTGQFKPIGDAQPHIGSLNTLEVLQEYRVEMICRDDLIQKAVRTLKQSHPYEEVAYEVYKLECF